MKRIAFLTVAVMLFFFTVSGQNAALSKESQKILRKLLVKNSPNTSAVKFDDCRMTVKGQGSLRTFEYKTVSSAGNFPRDESSNYFSEGSGVSGGYDISVKYEMSLADLNAEKMEITDARKRGFSILRLETEKRESKIAHFFRGEKISQDSTFAFLLKTKSVEEISGVLREAIKQCK